MNIIKIVALVFPLVCFDYLMASGESNVPFTFRKVTITTEEAGYGFSLELDDEGRLSGVVASWEGGEHEIPKGEIPAIPKVLLELVEVKTPSPISTGAHKRVILVIPFQTSLNGKEDEHELTVANVLRIWFSEGRFFMWEKSVSKGEFRNSWEFQFKDQGGEAVSGGVEEGVLNPFWENSIDEWRKDRE